MSQLEETQYQAITPIRTRLIDVNQWSLDNLPYDEVQYKALKQDISDAGEIRIPVEVYEVEGGRYRIKEGNHRFMAADELGFMYVPCRIVPQQTAEEEQADIMKEDGHRRHMTDAQYIANELRLSKLAGGLKRGVTRQVESTYLGIDQIADKYNKSPTYIRRVKRILETPVVPDSIKARLGVFSVDAVEDLCRNTLEYNKEVARYLGDGTNLRKAINEKKRREEIKGIIESVKQKELKADAESKFNDLVLGKDTKPDDVRKYITGLKGLPQVENEEKKDWLVWRKLTDEMEKKYHDHIEMKVEKLEKLSLEEYQRERVTVIWEDPLSLKLTYITFPVERFKNIDEGNVWAKSHAGYCSGKFELGQEPVWVCYVKQEVSKE